MFALRSPAQWAVQVQARVFAFVPYAWGGEDHVFLGRGPWLWPASCGEAWQGWVHTPYASWAFCSVLLDILAECLGPSLLWFRSL
ncbi:hypothetical protein AK812_SmicGene15302 [Symbiodinium microadriaticum]|uniref:Uncharacterized protein n=1 Tax=Symbiodinium microadriaticum TaxID=2951 RepID=A0A1Q9E3B7_SYMMI|nr:hypothetical protein AK812_SmicGene15302 [Symbiodinium microadriaticum]